MAYEFLPNNLANGAAQIVIPLLAAYQKFALLTAPVTEAVMRASMEADQVAPYTDESWLAFMTQMASIGFNDGTLTIAERTVINTIRQVVNPPAGFACCSTPGTVPLNGDGLTALESFVQLGFPNFQHEIRLILDKSLTCDIKKVQVILNKINPAAPDVTPFANFNLFFNKCSSNEKSLFSNLNVQFTGNPSGFSYTITYDYFDSNNVQIAAYAAAYNLTL